MHYRPFVTRVGLALGLGLSLVSLTGCSSSVKVTTEPTVLDTNVEGVQGHVSTRVAQGQTLTVKLPTRTGTTYGWRLAPESNEGSSVFFVERMDQMTDDRTIAFGDDSAIDIFTFKANKPGMQTLEFIYDCQPGGSKSKSMRMTLDVEVYNAKSEAIAKMKAAEEARVAAEQALKAAREAEAIASAETSNGSE